MKSSVLSIILQVLESVLQVLLPVLSKALVKLHIKFCPPKDGEDKVQYRATVRQWVVDMLTELGSDLANSNLLPSWAAPIIPVAEGLVAQGIDSALDALGL